MPTLITNNLTKIYQTRDTVVNALIDVSLSVETGEFVTIMGASGSGKSTLLHLVAGLATPTRGNVILNDIDLFSLNDSERTKFRLRNIGIVFQSFNLIPTLTTRENILLPSQIDDGRKISEDELGKLLDTLELNPRCNHRPDSLSGGEQQRVAIARALMMSPAIILADEPTGNLDSVNSENICKTLRQLCDNDKRTIILVTHDKMVADWGDRRVTLRDGQIAREQ